MTTAGLTPRKVPIKGKLGTFQGTRYFRTAPRIDPSLAYYFREVTKIPLLTPAQETSLAKRYQKLKDQKAGEKLVRSNLRLVAKIAYGYKNSGVPVADLIQEGNLGLIEAVKKFNPKKAKLSTYSAFWIKMYIQKYIKRRISQEKPEEEIPEQAGRKQLASESLGPEEEVSVAQEEKKLSDVVGAALNKLNKNEQYVVRNRIMSEEPVTLDEIGKELNLTRERVRQIERDALVKLKQYLSIGGETKMEKGIVQSLDEVLEKGRKPGAKDLKKRKARMARITRAAYAEQYERGKPGPRSFGKGLNKSEGNAPKLTKDELKEWLDLRILNQAKSRIHEGCTIENLSEKLYNGLVEDWSCTPIALQACRAVQCSQLYVMGIISTLFDSSGKPILEKEEKGGSDVHPVAVGEGSYPQMATNPYYASMVTLDEAHEEFEKARKTSWPQKTKTGKLSVHKRKKLIMEHKRAEGYLKHGRINQGVAAWEGAKKRIVGKGK